MLVLTLVAPQLQADNTIPVGVKIELAHVLTDHWARGRAEMVTTGLVERLVQRLKEEHPHWRFLPGFDPSSSPAALKAKADWGGSNEMLLNLDLELYTHTTPTGSPQLHATFELGKTVLYEPGHFSAYGRPNPTQAKNDIWRRLQELLAIRRQPSLKTLTERVPLARKPSRIRMPERTVVLPLSRERYERLAWSTFRLQCQGPGLVELHSEANNKWAPYNMQLPIALKVTVVDNRPDAQLQGLTPVLVYLKEYKPKFGWLFVSN